MDFYMPLRDLLKIQDITLQPGSAATKKNNHESTKKQKHEKQKS